MQRRLVSLIEAVVGTCSGFGVSVLVGVFLYPLFGVTFSLAELSGITAVFTGLSILRGFLVRRLFNMAHVRGWW